MKTYTSTRANPLSFLREAYSLYRFKSTDISGQVHGTIECMRRCEQRIHSAIGIRLEGLKMLIVGPGQTPREMAYLGCRNEVVGIDLDVIPQGVNPAVYLRMLKQNGVMRTVKTAARKALGLDSRMTNELKRQLGVTALPRAQFLQMDAAAMEFQAGSFDFVYSFSVFEHLPDPGAVIDETVRVLKPGGGCYLSLHLFTSENGCHDLRIFANNRAGIPYWSHLRTQHALLIQANAYLNEVRLADWMKLFSERMPGVQFELDFHEHGTAEVLTKELAELRAAGELSDYTDEELLAVNLIAIWRKSPVE
jgi:SAM-dependent methyltransferase